MNVDLTHGSIFRGLLRFSLPLMAGNLLQQLYNLVDTFVVGRYCGEIALAAVGSAFSVMILLTSIVTGLCMGSGVVVSQLFGQKDDAGVRKAVGNAFVLIAGVSALLTILSYALLPVMMALLRIPPEAQGVLSRYLLIVFIGIIPTFLYNFGACMLRAVGNSTAPLVFLLISSLTNVALDFLFVAVLPWGVAGAAVATLISQVLSGFLCLCALPRSGADALAARPAPRPCAVQAHLLRLCHDQHSAVHHEFRHPVCAESREQLRSGSDGGIHRRRED